ncbi:hypothetical protein DSLASN_09110 [Desulfoluna limicola]|uniref:Uncharacterized protein n=1 Tax=Desulfoluna limicola TaxID=2810562 RepID=A0ABM7PDP8_9BACT|nr:hypothetical protein DSLASN_09110 [Desulfoluna limicola]
MSDEIGLETYPSGSGIKTPPKGAKHLNSGQGEGRTIISTHRLYIDGINPATNYTSQG